MSSPVTRSALITGASSGIGLNLVKHLLAATEIKWRVIMADINSEAGQSLQSELESQCGQDRVLFIHMDVSSFDSNAAGFRQAYEWSNERLDFFAANAGTPFVDRTFLKFDIDEELTSPDLKTLEVNLNSVYYGLKCFLYYVRKTRRNLETTPDEDEYHPQMVATASCTGLYKFLVNPGYGSSKAGIIHLVRSVSAQLAREDDLCLNCICPGLTYTGMISMVLQENFPEATFITPFSTLMRAYDELIAGISGPDSRKIGQVVEASGDRLYYREPVEYSDGNMHNLIEDPLGFWKRDLYAEMMEKERLEKEKKPAAT